MNQKPRPLTQVAGIVALGGALVSFVSLFPDYYRDGFAGNEFPAQLWLTLVFVAGAVAAGVLMLVSERAQTIGASAAVATSVFFLGSRVLSVWNATRTGGPDPGAGLWLELAGYVIVAIAAVIAGLDAVNRGVAPAGDGARGPIRAWLAAAGAGAGLVAAYGFGLNFYRFSMAPAGVRGEGSPLFASPRTLWAELIVVVALVLVPIVIARSARAVACGLSIGLMTFVVAEVLWRVQFTSSGIRGRPSTFDPIEGTWVFLVGGLLLVVVVTLRFAVVPDGTRAAGPPPGPPAATPAS